MEVLQTKEMLGQGSQQLVVESVHPRGYMASGITDSVGASQIKITGE